MHQSHKPSKRPTIGFFGDDLFDPHEEELRRTIIQETESADVNLLCFLGGPGRGQRQGRTIYDLATPENVDGIIAMSGCLDIGDDESVEAFFRRYAPVPIVSINKLVRGTSSLLVDNEVGVRQLMDHFLEVHRLERIAFIRGPAHNEEATARLDAYRAALERHGLPYEPARVFQGDWNPSSGIEAVRTFLDERRIDFDAIVGANDYVAVYAMKELQRRGFKVPDDVAVGGFDNIRHAASVLPSLTTVSQPMQAMGKAAVDRVLAMIREEAAPESTCFHTEAVIRRSCGCQILSDEVIEVDDLTACDEPSAGCAPRTALAHRLEALYPWVKERIRTPSWAEDLAGELFGRLERIPGSRFIPILHALVARGLEYGITTTQWRCILKTAFDTARHQVGSQLWEQLTLLRESSLLLLGDLAEQSQAAFGLQLEEEAQTLQHVFRPTGVDEEEIRQALQTELPKIGIRNFYLVRYTTEMRDEALLDFHFSLSNDVILDASLGTYASRRLVPGRFTQDHRYAYAVLPIHSSAEQIGFTLCELGSVSGVTFVLLVNQLGRALKTSALMKEVKRYAGELETRVEQRTRQLSEAQQQLIETAHQAGMAEIAVGVMHNIGNLLNSVSVSAEGIASVATGSRMDGLVKLNDLFSEHRSDLIHVLGSDSKVGLLLDYCGKLAETLEGERRHIRKEAEELLEKTALIRETIRTLQEHARDGKDVLLDERIDLQVVIEAALKIQAANAARHGVEIVKKVQDTPPISGRRANVVHILVNLIKNAIEAMRNRPADSRCLTVELKPYPGGAVMVRVSDTGDGIPKENLDRIFSYGFTTKPDGHGFGLHTCANYVSQMSGSMTVTSQGPGQGAMFTLVFKATSLAPVAIRRAS